MYVRTYMQMNLTEAFECSGAHFIRRGYEVVSKSSDNTNNLLTLPLIYHVCHFQVPCRRFAVYIQLLYVSNILYVSNSNTKLDVKFFEVYLYL